MAWVTLVLLVATLAALACSYWASVATGGDETIRFVFLSIAARGGVLVIASLLAWGATLFLGVPASISYLFGALATYGFFKLTN